MRLTIQKELAAKVLKCGKDRVWISPERVADVKEAVTAQDILSLVRAGLIQKKQKTGQSRVRARHHLIQRRKGRRSGHGSRKGKATARGDAERVWVNKVRVQRRLLKKLKNAQKISTKTFRELYRKSKGGFFRSERHVKIYLDERDLFLKSKDRDTTQSSSK